MQQPNKWEEYLHFVEFTYNNSYHESLKMSPYKKLYGIKCRTPTNWSNLEDNIILGPDMLVEMEKTLKKVRHNLKVAQYRQKAYAYNK